MRKTLFIFILLIFCKLIIAQYSFPYPQSYLCIKTSDSIQIDGLLNEPIWSKIKSSQNFKDIINPQSNEKRQKTSFKMCWDDSNLYIGAYLQEKDICAFQTMRESIVYQDNAFEIFIDPDGDNHNYYELELNAINTIWDLNLDKPYRDCARPNSFWNCENMRSAIKLYGSLNNPLDKDTAWTLEISIPFSSLGGFPTDSIWRMNFARSIWEYTINQNLYTRKTNSQKMSTWTPQFEKNMHKPEFWGYVQFTKNGKLPDSLQYKDEYFDAKMALMKHYTAQRKYHKYNDKYSGNQDELEIQIEGLTIFSTGAAFISGIRKNGVLWLVNQDGKLWTQVY